MSFLSAAKDELIDDLTGIKDIPKNVVNAVTNTADKIKTDGLESYVTGRSADDDFLADHSNLTLSTVNSLKGAAKAAETINTLVEDSLKSLNNINGVQELLGGFNSDACIAILQSISNNIDSLGNGLYTMHEYAEAYSNASFFKRFLATKLMGDVLAVEGGLSVIEDLGDLVFGVVGWVAPEGSKVEKAMSKWSEFEWAHYLADKAYYSTDLAKASAITEDSLIGKATEFGGSLVSFGGVTKVVGGTAKAAAKVAGAVGAGSKTEQKLQEGYDIDSAFGAGAETGVKDALLFWVLGEGVNKVKKVKVDFKDYDAAKMAEANAGEVTIEKTKALAAEENSLKIRERTLKGAETKARNSDVAVAAQETTVANSQKAVEVAEKAEAQSATNLDQAEKRLETSTLDSKIDTMTDDLSKLYNKKIKTGSTKTKIEELKKDIDTARAKQDSLVADKEAAQTAYESDSKALETAKQDLTDANKTLDKLRNDNVRKHESIDRAQEKLTAQKKEVNQAANELQEAEKAQEAAAKKLEKVGEQAPLPKNIDELGAVKGTAKTIKDSAVSTVENAAAKVKEIPGKVGDTLSRPKDYIDAKIADKNALQAETDAKAAYDSEVSKLDAAQESQKDISNILEKKKADLHNYGYDSQIDDLKAKIEQIDSKRIKLPGTSSKKMALQDARNELIGERDAFIRDEINPAKVNLEEANKLVADQQVKVNTAGNEYADAISNRFETSRNLAEAGQNAPLLRNIDEAGLIKGTGKTIGNSLSSGVNKAISNYGVGTPVSTSSSMVIKGGVDTFDNVDGRIINTNDASNVAISSGPSQPTDGLTPDRLVGNTAPEPIYHEESPVPTADTTTPVSDNYGAPNNGSSNTYQYRQYPGDISGTATGNGTTTSPNTYIDENGYEVGSDEAYEHLNDDISGTATDGVNVDDSSVNPGETRKSWATYDPVNGYDSLEDQQARLENENISGTATDGVTVDNSSVNPGETRKSWATYDPETGYDSLEQQQARIAKQKVTSMFDKLKNNTGNEDISGTATDGVNVDNSSVNLGETRKSWATYDPVNGYDSLENQQAKLAKENMAAVNNASVTTPSSETASPVSINPETNLNDKQTIVTPPSDTSSSSGTTYHSGGYTPPVNSSNNNQNSYVAPTPTPTPEPEPVQEPVVETPKPEVENPVEEVTPKESKVTKIPTVTPSTPTKETSGGVGGSRIIPIAAGIGAAAAAGLGAKAYLDRKENTDNGEDDDWDSEVDEGNKPMDISYEDNDGASESVLDEDDDYTSTDEEEIVERYDARANDELADLQ